MNKSLKGKLILSFLAVALITVLVASVLIRVTSSQSLMHLVSEQQTAMLTEAAQTYYSENGTMDGFFSYYVVMERQNTLSNPPNNEPSVNLPDTNEKPPQTHDFRGVQGLVDTEYRALIPTMGHAIGETLPQEMIRNAVAVKVDGEIIAWVLPDTNNQFSLRPEEELFLKRTTVAISLAALAGVIVAVIMGILLAGGLVKPIRRLTQASKSLAQGELLQKVPVTSQDELGQLTTTFNQMSEDLVRADEQRKRLTADITHDLSTPLQVISGYMEMIDEGEVTLSPQRIEIIKTEIEHLRRLVGDLTTLSQVEAQALDMHLQPTAPGALLEKIQQTFLPIAARQGVDLRLNLPASSPAILVDEGRTLQVLKNLVENALRYTPKGGKIELGLAVSDRVELFICDTGAGIDEEDLPYVFDRFYRADKSRGSNSGKMGLGLAICKALINTQGGIILAESAGKGQGTTIRISFSPLHEDASPV